MNVFASRPLTACALTALLAGCQPLAMAGMAMSAITGGEGSSIMRNPMDRPRGEDLQDSLSTIDDSVADACREILEKERKAAEENAAPVRDDADDSDPPRCRVTPVCLPGAAEPTEMMMCHEDGGVAESSEAFESGLSAERDERSFAR